MNASDVLAHCLGEPGAWRDEPWEGDVVVTVGDKMSKLPKQHRPEEHDVMPDEVEQSPAAGRTYVPPRGQVLTPYICPREAARAIEWYADIFGATETTERFVDPDGRVGHAQLEIDGAEIMVSDAYPDFGAVAPAAGNTTATFALNLYEPDADATMAAAERAGAVMQRPVEEQFYGSRLGTLVDPFGVRWMIATQVRDVAQADVTSAVEEFRAVGAERS